MRAQRPDPRTRSRSTTASCATPATLEVVAEGFEALRELAAASRSARYAGTETRPGDDVTAQRARAAEARGFFHPVGTCAIGAVVDPSGRVFGYEGLSVADASVMPTIPTANTNLTTAAIAERVAELG